jgi:hypothetical protein
MRSGQLGVDDQDPLARVALALGGQERRGQLPLARPPGRVGRRVPGQQRLRAGEAVADRCGNALEVGDLAVVDPHPQAALAQGRGERADRFGVGVGVADEDVVRRVHASGCLNCDGVVRLGA